MLSNRVKRLYLKRTSGLPWKLTSFYKLPPSGWLKVTALSSRRGRAEVRNPRGQSCTPQGLKGRVHSLAPPASGGGGAHSLALVHLYFCGCLFPSAKSPFASLLQASPYGDVCRRTWGSRRWSRANPPPQSLTASVLPREAILPFFSFLLCKVIITGAKE